MRLAGAAAVLLLCALLNGVSSRIRPAGWPLCQGLGSEGAVEAASLLSLGMRRLAADLGLVRLLIYYGSQEADEDAEHDGGQPHEAFDAAHPERSWGGGEYPELGPRALRVLDADPAFSYAAFYASGALAFNLNRPDQALRVLEYALSRDPRNVQYQAYAAAIGFHRHGDAAGVIRLLGPILESPDCPAMVKNMVAYLYLKTNRREAAIRLYREILATGKDPGYRRMAQAALARMDSSH